jgi:hypothetical protein
MGHSYFIECQKCEYKSEEITMGVGFLFGNIDDILHALRGNDKKTVQLLKHRKQIHTHYSRGYSLYQCRNCKSLENKCHLTLYNQQGDLIFQTESIVGLVKTRESICQRTVIMKLFQICAVLNVISRIFKSY